MLKSETTTSTSTETENDPLKVCIQGYAGAFHEIAARFCFNEENIEIVPAHTFDDLVQKVDLQEEVNIGMMAIENTLSWKP